MKEYAWDRSRISVVEDSNGMYIRGSNGYFTKPRILKKTLLRSIIRDVQPRLREVVIFPFMSQFSSTWTFGSKRCAGRIANFAPGGQNLNIYVLRIFNMFKSRKSSTLNKSNFIVYLVVRCGGIFLPDFFSNICILIFKSQVSPFIHPVTPTSWFRIALSKKGGGGEGADKKGLTQFPSSSLLHSAA